MFAVGDMHASMGDGEICFTGVEIAGEVDIRFDLLKGKQATWPVTELADRWLPHATAYDYADALQLVSEEAARMLVDEHGFSIEDAFIFLSVACDAGRRAGVQAGPRGSGRSPASRSRRSTPARARSAPRSGRYNSGHGGSHHEPCPRGRDLRRRSLRGDHRREVDGPARPRPVRGPRRFSQLEHSCSGISPRTLAERLRALETEGILERRSYPESPPRVEYELTEKGVALLPIISAMRRYGHAWLDCEHVHADVA